MDITQANIHGGGWREQARRTTEAEAAEHESNLRRDIESLRGELKHDIRETAPKLEAKLAETKADLTHWVIGVGVLQTTIVVGVLLKAAKLI